MTTLYYFTGTGNSLKIARDLAEALGGAEPVPVTKALAAEAIAPETEAVGLVFPVYMWGLPLIVERFARRLTVRPSQYLFAVANFGGFEGGTLVQLRNVFAERGITLGAGFGVKMPGNYTPMYGALPEHRQQALFAREEEKVASIAEQVKNRARVLEKDSILVKWLFWDLVYRFSSPHIPGMDRGFRADERCNGCGLCAKVCPAGNIVMTGGRPEWRHGCEQCLACLHWCPQEAVQLGKNTPGRKRYRCPGVTASDLTR